MNTRTLNPLVIFATAAVLSGCNTVYHGPTTPEGSARVRFVAIQEKNFRSYLGVYVHAGDECGMPNKVVALGGGPVQFGGASKKDGEIGMSKDPRSTYVLGQYFEIPIASEKRFYFTLAGGERGHVCHISASFVPRENAEYEVTYATAPGACFSFVDEISIRDSRFVKTPERSTLKRPRACSFFWN